MIGIDTYDEYGIPGSGNVGRFGYTGQAWLSELGLQYSRARIYSPTLGRFLQSDPIGYAGDGPNLYAYVLNDPVNFTDPFGLCNEDPAKIYICAHPDGPGHGSAGGAAPGGNRGETGRDGCVGDCRDIVITAKKPKSKKSCVATALGEGAFSIGVDAIGLIPEAGGAKTLARRIGHWRGYRGIVADQTGRAAIRGASDTSDYYGIVQGINGRDGAEVALGVAGFIPVVGQFAAAFSIGNDVYKTWKQIGSCQ
jgi:RHS repeat-associated protein